MTSLKFVIVGSKKCRHCINTKRILMEKYGSENVYFNSFLGFKELLYSYRKVFDNCIGETRYIPLTFVIVDGYIRGFVVGSRNSNEWDEIIEEILNTENKMIYGSSKKWSVDKFKETCISAIDEMKNFLDFNNFTV